MEAIQRAAASLIRKLSRTPPPSRLSIPEGQVISFEEAANKVRGAFEAGYPYGIVIANLHYGDAQGCRNDEASFGVAYAACETVWEVLASKDRGLSVRILPDGNICFALPICLVRLCPKTGS